MSENQDVSIQWGCPLGNKERLRKVLSGKDADCPGFFDKDEKTNSFILNSACEKCPHWDKNTQIIKKQSTSKKWTDSYVQNKYCKKCKWFYDMSDWPIQSECAHPDNVDEDNVAKKWPSEIVSQTTGCSWFERETLWDGIRGFFGFPPWNPKGKYFFENGSWVLWFAGAVTFLAILLCSIFKCK